MQQDDDTVKDKSMISFTLFGQFDIRVLLVAGHIARITWRAMTGTTGERPALRSRCSFTISRAVKITEVPERVERYLLGKAR